jgi:hypothetical protein
LLKFPFEREFQFGQETPINVACYCRAPRRARSYAMPELALSNEQQSLVVAAAGTVPPRWRQGFLATVQDLLLGNSRPTNRQVINACAAARRAIGLGVGPPSID